MSWGGLSPLQITTGIIIPPTAAAVIRHTGIDIDQLDDQVTLNLDDHVKALATLQNNTATLPTLTDDICPLVIVPAPAAEQYRTFQSAITSCT